MGGVMMKTNLHKDHAKRKPHAKMGTTSIMVISVMELWPDPNLKRLSPLKIVLIEWLMGLSCILLAVLESK